MSKMLVYILDKFVWMLVITVLTAQTLQIAGVVDSPKGLELGQITYNQDNEYEYKIGTGENENRDKRQAGDRSPLLDNIFNIPIATLNAVNELVQSSRPAFERLRQSARSRLDAVYAERKQRSQSTEGPKVQADGSSSRVLLKV